MAEEPYQDDNSSAPKLSDRFRFSHQNSGGERWLVLAAQILVGIIIIILLVLAGRYIHHHFFVKKNSPTTTTQTTGSNPATGGTTRKSSSSSKKSSDSGSSSKTLANTGPGNTVAVFAGASLLAGSAHLLVSARRQSAKR